MRARWLTALIGIAIATTMAGARVTQAPADGTRLRGAATDVARWLRGVAIQTPDGLAWASTPAASQTPLANLYSGSPGVVLFFLELHHATGQAADLETARKGADWLLAQVERENQAGLYTGLAGIGFTLTEAWKATGDKKYRDGANRVVDRLKELAKPVGEGVEWSPVSDIISGSAGVGLYLISAARELERPDALTLAGAAGRRLISQKIAAGGGAKWAMTPGTPTRLYPNFSHGTAGVAYFLVTLAQAAKDTRFLDAARDGATYLLSVAKTEGDVCLVFHHEPEQDGLDLFYLGWCHGPAGTARLFRQMAVVTTEPAWTDWMRKSANGLKQSGVPQKQTPGFWNNVGQCCGSASVADFFLSYYHLTRDAEALTLARRATDQILSKATRDDQGLRWIHAENRVQPDNLTAQTGWMQGAAGIGAWLLRLDAFDHGKPIRIVLPDNPFSATATR
jgi:lantibiotic modifying enzyme